MISIAKKYVNKGIHINDLIQEGNLGLAEQLKSLNWIKISNSLRMQRGGLNRKYDVQLPIRFE